MKGEFTLKSVPLYIWIIVAGLFAMACIGYYQFNDMEENTKTQLVNETMRASLYTSVDYGNTRVSGELFVDKQKFEDLAKQKIEEKMPGSIVTFDYLLLASGAIKAIKMIVTETDGEPFSSTYKVNEAL